MGKCLKTRGEDDDDDDALVSEQKEHGTRETTCAQLYMLPFGIFSIEMVDRRRRHDNEASITVIVYHRHLRCQFVD
jgi:hypothetical protein